MWLVYGIMNKITSETYVGCTNNLNKRISSHLRSASLRRSRLARDLDELTILQFEIAVLEDRLETEASAIEREMYYIKVLDTFNHGYNSNEGGYGQPKGCTPWNKGLKGVYTDEHRAKISGRRRGVATTPKGSRNDKAAENGRRGAMKIKTLATGRKRLTRDDGSWTWMYPRSDGTWYIRDRQTRNSKWKEVDVTPPLTLTVL